MTFDEALSYLLSLGHETLTIKLGLKNTETLLAALGNPQKDFPSVQIAGTNGKGSTAVMLDSICRRAGIRAGLFTSPHLISITERIKISGDEISEIQFAQFTEKVKETAEALVRKGRLHTLPTFFEHVTAIALLAFRAAKVDLAILETGLGGRLDSTTAAGADVVAITPVALDHEEYLGNTIQQVAAEKAAIIHPGATAIIAPQPAAALEVIFRQCDATNVEPLLCGESTTQFELTDGERFCTAHLTDIADDGRCVVTFETPQRRYENVSLGLLGRHQIDNAAVAVALAEVLHERGFAISDEAIPAGIEKAAHAGRLERWDGEPQLLFDGAHNPAAALTLRDFLDEFVPSPITMIFGAMKDKRLTEMAAMLLPKADELILTELENPRAAPLEVLRAALPQDLGRAKLHQARSIQEALEIAYEITPAHGLICITGSLYLIGAAQQALRRQKNPSVFS